MLWERLHLWDQRRLVLVNAEKGPNSEKGQANHWSRKTQMPLTPTQKRFLGPEPTTLKLDRGQNKIELTAKIGASYSIARFLFPVLWYAVSSSQRLSAAHGHREWIHYPLLFTKQLFTTYRTPLPLFLAVLKLQKELVGYTFDFRRQNCWNTHVGRNKNSAVRNTGGTCNNVGHFNKLRTN